MNKMHTETAAMMFAYTGVRVPMSPLEAGTTRAPSVLSKVFGALHRKK